MLDKIKPYSRRSKQEILKDVCELILLHQKGL